MDSIGSDLTQQQAKIILQGMIGSMAINAHDATLIMAAVSDRALAKVDSDIRSVVRADIFKNALVGLMVDNR